MKPAAAIAVGVAAAAVVKISTDRAAAIGAELAAAAHQIDNDPPVTDYYSVSALYGKPPEPDGLDNVIDYYSASAHYGKPSGLAAAGTDSAVETNEPEPENEPEPKPDLELGIELEPIPTDGNTPRPGYLKLVATKFAVSGLVAAGTAASVIAGVSIGSAAAPPPRPELSTVTQTPNINFDDYATQLLNQTRFDHDLTHLITDINLETLAANHANQLAANEELFNNPTFNPETVSYSITAESVFSGTTIEAAYNALLESPTNYEAITDARIVAFGTAHTTGPDGTIYAVALFAGHTETGE